MSENDRRGGAAQLVAALRRPKLRRIGYVLVALVLAVLCVFPRSYVAKSKMLPQDEQSGGLAAVLGSLGGGLQNFASLIGTHQTVEVYLLIARSNDVFADVVNRLHLVGPHGYRTAEAAKLSLARRVDIHSLTGGILEIQARDADPVRATLLTTTFGQAIQDRVAELSREQTAKKRLVIETRYKDAGEHLAQAQAALDQFRRTNRLAEPGAQFGSALGLKTTMQGEIMAKQVALQTAREFQTDNSIEVKTLQADIASLQRQVAQVDAGSPTNEDFTLSALAVKNTEYLNLFRTEKFEEALYDTYTRSLEQVSVEDAIADVNTNIQIVEGPHVVPGRHFNIPAVGALLAVLLLAFYTEYYVPATRLGYRREPRPDAT